MNTTENINKPEESENPAKRDLSEAPCSPDLDMRNKIGGLALEDHPLADNFAIALVSYFEEHEECPDEEADDEVGWKPWAIAKANAALDRLVIFIKENVRVERSEREGTQE